MPMCNRPQPLPPEVVRRLAEAVKPVNGFSAPQTAEEREHQALAREDDERYELDCRLGIR